jgi:hypothetical protein
MWRYIATVKTVGDQRREIAGGPFDFADLAFRAAWLDIAEQRVSVDDVTRVIVYRGN